MCAVQVFIIAAIWFWDISHFLQWWSVVWLVPLEFAVSEITVWDWRHLWPNCEDIFYCSKSLLYTIVIFVYCNIFVCNIFLWFCFCNIYFCLYTIVNSLLLQYISELSCTDGWFLFIYLFCLGSAGACVCSAGAEVVQCRCVQCSAVLKWWCSDCIRVLSLFRLESC